MEFRLLGPVEAYRQGRPVDLGRRRERCLLCLLLLETGRTVPVDRLLDLLWDGSPPETGRGQLRVNVSRLRSRLDTAGTGVRITARGGGYLVDADPDSIDVHRFRVGVQQARQLPDPAARATALTTALALWRGPLMADVATDQLRARVGAGLDDLRLSAAELRAESALAAGQHDGLVADLAALVAEQPGRERLVGLLMLALYRSGRPAEALAAYRAARRVLVDEFGLEPGAPLRLLHEQILRDDPAIAAPGAPVAAGTGARRYLPRDIGDFTGRTGELAWLAEAARDTSGAVPVAVVVGPAGVGKTALAVRFAHRVAARFGDGQLYLDLRGFAPGPPVRTIDALARLLRALGVEPDRVPADPVEAAGLYRSLLVERRVLVLLDNAGSAEQIRPLLPGGPGCLALVTSRDRLTGLVARDGARRLTLDVLEPGESLALLGRIVGRHRLDAEPGAAAGLVELCDRLPLALRIAAATLADHPHRPIAEQVAALAHGDRLGALQVPGDAHGGVRAAFNQSYAALGPDARRLYRQLGLVPGPDLTAETAAAVARTGTGEAAKLLDRLAGAHLVDTHANGRYGMHDLLRLYARELAAAEDTDADRQATLDRLYDHYLDRVAEAARLLYPQKLRLPRPPSPRPAEGLSPAPAEPLIHAELAGRPAVGFDEDAQASVLPGPVRARAGPASRAPVAFDEHAQASAWLDAERANLVAAVTHAAEHGPRPAAWLLADSLRGYFWLSMYTVDWLATARAGLAAAEADGDLRARAAAQLSLGDLHWRQGEHRRAIERYTRALALARRAGWRECQAAVLGNLGNTYRLSGQPRRAANHVIQALALNRQAGLLAGEAVNLGNLGVAYFELGRLQQAANWYGEALGRHQKAGSRSGEAIMLGNLAEVRHAQGHFDQAREHLDRSLALTREIGDRANEAEVLRILACVGHDTGRHDEAFKLARTAVSLAAGTGHHRFEALTLTTLATIHRDLGQHQRAIDGYRHAIDLAAGAGDRYPHVGALLGLAVADQHLGRHEPALTHAGEALGLAREAGFRMLEGQARTVLAAIHLGQHRRDVAVREAHRALAVHHETGHRQGAADTHLVLAHALRHTDPPDARIHQRQATALLADIGLAPAARLRALSLPLDGWRG